MSVVRSKELGALLETMLPFLPIKDFNPFNWLMDDRNICLTDGEGSIALFEYDEGIYNGHYFFKVRGKDAVRLSKECLEELFTVYGVEVLRGFTPKKHKGAMWLTTHLGFKPIADTIIDDEPNQIWLMTKHQYEVKYGQQV